MSPTSPTRRVTALLGMGAATKLSGGKGRDVGNGGTGKDSFSGVERRTN